MSDKFMCIIAISMLQWAMILLFLNWNGSLPRRSVQISDSSDFNELTKDSPMTVIGFGKRKEVDGEKSDPATILHQVQVPFVPLPECKTKGSDEDAKDDYSKLTNNAFCAVRLEKTLVSVTAVAYLFDSNNGRKQMGVVSWGMAVVEPIVLVFILTSAFLMIG